MQKNNIFIINNTIVTIAQTFACCVPGKIECMILFTPKVMANKIDKNA